MRDAGEQVIDVSVRLKGDLYHHDDESGWRGPEELELKLLRWESPPDRPSIPNWPQLAAETMRDRLGADIVYVRHRKSVPGRVY